MKKKMYFPGCHGFVRLHLSVARTFLADDAPFCEHSSHDLDAQLCLHDVHLSEALLVCNLQRVPITLRS